MGYLKLSYFVLLFSLWVNIAGGQIGERGDVPPVEELTCGGCGGSIALAVILTLFFASIIAALWWHLYVKKRFVRIHVKPDPESAAKAAYDNPHFQGDDLETSVQTPEKTGNGSHPVAKVSSTATNTTGTLERGRTTLERVMAVIGGKSPIRTKDDSCLGSRQVSVPLQAQDFTGLGFSIQGSLKEGIFVKELSARGPASESGQIMPGDRVTALTVLTENIVFEDACTILTYASPYPVLLHLEKSSGPLPSPMKGSRSALNTHSGALVHPSFRSESHGDLPKLGNLDIQNLKLGKIVPPKSEGNLSASFGFDVPKIQTNLVQRINETRHSERAIDVPGVDVRPSKNSSVKIDMGATLDDPTDLANVQIHRAVSPTIDLGRPDLTLIVPPFTDADLSGSGESVKVMAEGVQLKPISGAHPDPKLKFGVKVFPDIGGVKRPARKISGSSDKSDEISTGEQNKENEKKLDIDLSIEKPVFKIKKESKSKSKDKASIDNEKNLKAEISSDIDTKKSGGKFGFGFGFKGFGKDQGDKNEESDKSKDRESESEGSDGEKKKKSKFGFSLEGPDITLPSLSMKGKVNKEGESSDNSEGEGKIKAGITTKNIDIKGPKIDMPSANVNISSKEVEAGATNDKQSHSGDFKFKTPGFNLPSFGMKSKEKDSDSEKDQASDKESKGKKNETKKHSLKFHAPDIPTLNMEGKFDAKENIEKTLSLDEPDIALPSVNLKLTGEGDNKTDKCSNIGLGLKAPSVTGPTFTVKTNFGDEKDSVEAISRHGEEVEGGSKIKFPFNLGFSGKVKEPEDELESPNINLDIDSPNVGVSTEVPDINIGGNIEIENKIKIDKPSLKLESKSESEKSDSKHGFKLKGPHINIPSFGFGKSKHDDQELQGKSSSPGNIDSNVEINLKAPSITGPSLQLDEPGKSDKEIKQDKEKSKGKSKHGFKLDGPDLSFPSFGMKAKRKNSKDLPDKEEFNLDSNVDLNVKAEIPKIDPSASITIDTKEVKAALDEVQDKSIVLEGSVPKLDVGFKNNDEKNASVGEKEGMEKEKTKKKGFFDVDIHLPSFEFSKNKGNKSPDEEIEGKNINLNIEAPKIDFETNDSKSKGKEKLKKKTSSDDESSKFGLSMKMPDVNLPSFEKKSTKEKKDKDDESEENSDKVMKKERKKSGKEKSGGFNFKFKGPDFSLPHFGNKDEKSVEDKVGMESPSVDIKVDPSNLTMSFDKPKIDVDINPVLKTNIVDVPDVSIDGNLKAGVEIDGNSCIEMEDKPKNQSDKGLEVDLNVPSLPSKNISLDVSSNIKRTKKSNKGSDSDSSEDKEKKEKSSMFDIKLPNISMPSFGFNLDNDKNEKEKSSDEGEISVDIKSPDMTIPKFEGKGNLDGNFEIGSDSSNGEKLSQNNKQKESGFKIKMPSFDMPSFKMKTESSRETGEVTAEIDQAKDFNIDLPEVSLDGPEIQSSKAESFGLTINKPNIDISSINKEITTEYSLPDELKMEASIKQKNEGISPLGEGMSGIVDIPSVSIGGNSSFDASHSAVSVSDGSLPSIPLRNSNKKNSIEISSNVNNFQINLPSVDMNVNEPVMSLDSGISAEGNESEDMEEEMDGGVNVTDAIKKKRFGFKVTPPSYSRPDFNLTGASNISTSIPTDDNKNQSDEMKTFNMQFKGANIGSLEDNGNSGFLEYDVITDESKSKNIDYRVNLPDISGLKRSEVSIDGDLDSSLPNECDEWKIQGAGIGSTDFKLKTEHKEKSVFTMPDITLSSKRDSEDKVEENIVPKASSRVFGVKINSTETTTLPEWEKFKRNLDVNSIDENGKSTTIESTTDLSFDSSMEVESDLPEADSDLKRSGMDLPEVDVDYSEAKMRMDGDKQFGMAFGFKGFKKHIKVDGLDMDSQNENIKYEIPDLSLSSNVGSSPDEYEKRTVEAINKANMVIQDLPEADISLNEVREAINPDITAKNGHSLFKISNKHKEKATLSDSDSDDDSNKKIEVNVELNPSIDHGSIKENIDEMKIKGKSSFGLGVKGASKLSDSEDTEAEGRISIEPEISVPQGKDKKMKKTFGFKGFGRSSSDTEEESTEKISDKPMQINIEEKAKVKNKSSLTFGFKSKGGKSSDSEENGENAKIDVDPQGDNRQRTKGNINFGFRQRSKSNDGNSNQADSSSGEVIRKEGMKLSTKEVKYSSKSESEAAEDEKLSLDAKGDDGKSKSKYGIGFGFRRSSNKTTSDSEGADNEDQKVSLDTKGQEKSSQPKNKSLKLGFKGLKNLKGKIQTEINKMRHDSSDDDDDDEDKDSKHGEKRKKMPKKKEKEKKVKRELEVNLDVSDEAMVSSAANAAKQNRRKKKDLSSSSSSSDSSSDEDATKTNEIKKKKKSKSKRKEEGRLVTTGVMDVDLPQMVVNTEEVIEVISPTERSIQLSLPTYEESEANANVARSEPNLILDSNYSPKISTFNEKTTPKRYVVVKEMKLKQTPSQVDDVEVNEVVEKVFIPKPVQSFTFPESQQRLTTDTDTDGGCYGGSDSDMDKNKSENVNFTQTSVHIKSSGNETHLTDSEELKRKATSLGDLSRLHEGAGMSAILERAVSLDFKNAAPGPTSLHVRRLHLPDSSATSIDEVDENAPLPSPKTIDLSSGLKSAGQWGTLEEAIKFQHLNNEHIKVKSSISAPHNTREKVEGAPVSNIEISGDYGSSVTALSVNRNELDDSLDDDNPPALPRSPVPVGPTTISVTPSFGQFSNSQDYSSSEANVIVVPANDGLQLQQNINVQLLQSPIHSETLSQSHSTIGSMTSISSESEMLSYSPRLGNSGDNEDLGGVTVTMVPAEMHPNPRVQSIEVTTSPPPVPPKPKSGRNSNSPPELISYENTSKVTINHDWIKENGDMAAETSDHNVSDEFITPDQTPLKSMTQITLDGEGYTVSDGSMSRTVIISNPVPANPVSIVQTDTNYPMPALRPRFEE